MKIEETGLGQHELVTFLNNVVTIVNQLKAAQDGPSADVVLSIGSTAQRVATNAITYNQDGTAYAIAANTAGTVLTGTQAVTGGKYQIYRVIATKAANNSGTISVLRGATAAGYNNEALAIAAIPATSADTMDLGYFTVTCVENFTENTTALNGANVTTSFHPKTARVSAANLSLDSF